MQDLHLAINVAHAIFQSLRDDPGRYDDCTVIAARQRRDAWVKKRKAHGLDVID